MEKVAQVVGEQVSEVYRVLVVDGDENLLALDRLALSKHGFEVETATSASDALVMMGDRPPDLVVLDVVLPDLSGWELLRRVRASSGEVAGSTAPDAPISRVIGSGRHQAGRRGPDRGDHRREEASRKPRSARGPFGPRVCGLRCTVRGARFATPVRHPG